MLPIQKMIDMNWYVAKIVYRIICGGGDHAAQFDEQLRLVSAIDKEQAFFKARHYGMKEEKVFRNVKRELVRWKIINVIDPHDMEEIADGVELYSRIEEKDDGDAYVDIVNDKARWVLHSCISELKTEYSIPGRSTVNAGTFEYVAPPIK
jgi:hypothetical protein